MENMEERDRKEEKQERKDDKHSKEDEPEHEREQKKVQKSGMKSRKATADQTEDDTAPSPTRLSTKRKASPSSLKTDGQSKKQKKQEAAKFVDLSGKAITMIHAMRIEELMLLLGSLSQDRRLYDLYFQEFIALAMPKEPLIPIPIRGGTWSEERLMKKWKENKASESSFRMFRNSLRRAMENRQRDGLVDKASFENRPSRSNMDESAPKKVIPTPVPPASPSSCGSASMSISDDSSNEAPVSTGLANK